MWLRVNYLRCHLPCKTLQCFYCPWDAVQSPWMHGSRPLQSGPAYFSIFYFIKTKLFIMLPVWRGLCLLSTLSCEAHLTLAVLLSPSVFQDKTQPPGLQHCFADYLGWVKHPRGILTAWQGCIHRMGMNLSQQGHITWKLSSIEKIACTVSSSCSTRWPACLGRTTGFE